MINPRPLDEANIFRLLQPLHHRLPHLFGRLQRRREQVRLERARLESGREGDRHPARVQPLLHRRRSTPTSFAQGLLALERNWRGPLPTNDGRLHDARSSSRRWSGRAAPQVLANWRFQQALYRAYYDAYTRAPADLRDGARRISAMARAAAARADGLARRDDAGGGDARPRRRGARGAGLARARLRAGRGAVPEHPDAVERAAVQGDLGGPRRQPRHHRRAAEQSPVAEGSGSPNCARLPTKRSG